jgi:hypothetical protein
MAEPFFGKYRGVVVDREDPERALRLRVTVPEVLGEQTVWAMPCLPCGDPTVPAIGAHVWVEFEAGDLDRPIWSGCFWDPGEAPEARRIG